MPLHDLDLRVAVEVNPVSLLATASRVLMEGTVQTGQIAVVLAVAAGLTAVFLPLTTHLYRRGERRTLRRILGRMPPRPAVTVVIATRDRAWVLPRALACVLDQSAGAFELVVVDDGSTDATPVLLDTVDDPRLVRLRTGGVGSAAARNAGVSAGSAPLVAFLDDDNTWSPRFLETMLAERGDAALAYCSQHVFLCRREPDDAITVLSRQVRSTPYNPVAFVRGSHVDTSSLLLTREVFDEVGGFDPGLRRLVDWDLVAGVVARHPFAVRHVDQVLCDYYLFLADGGAATITNAAISDARLLEHAGLGADDEDTARIRAKLAPLLHR